MSTNHYAADVYAKQMFPLGYGFPLWDAQPPHEDGEVCLGDVGFVSEGAFYRLFNATKPKDDKINRHGVPDGYVPFSAFSHDKRADALKPGARCSRTVKQLSAEMDASALHVGGAGLGFECNDEQGAVLVTQHGANREQMHPSRQMALYMTSNLDSWYEFSQTKRFIDVRKDAILFICGTYKTINWATASFLEAGKSAQFHFNVNPSVAQAALSFAQSKKAFRTPEQNWGPRETTEDHRDSSRPKSNQTIFINYYKRKKRLGLFPEVMKAAAGYDELPRGPNGGDGGAGASTQGASSSALSLEDTAARSTEDGTPGSTQPRQWDPVDYVLDYILKRAPTADVAVAKDGDLNEHCEDHGYLIPDVEDIPRFLEAADPLIEVTEDGVGMLAPLHEMYTYALVKPFLTLPPTARWTPVVPIPSADAGRTGTEDAHLMMTDQSPIAWLQPPTISYEERNDGMSPGERVSPGGGVSPGDCVPPGEGISPGEGMSMEEDM